MAVRRGEVPLHDVLADMHDRTRELEQALLASSLPDEADADAIDAFLIRAYEEAWRR
jgi:hypothetical protein